MYCQDRVFQAVKGLKKLYAYALDRKKTCSHANSSLVLLRLLSYKKMKKKKKMKNLYFIPHVTFSFSFLHAVTFLHVLHLDVLRLTESKN